MIGLPLAVVLLLAGFAVRPAAGGAPAGAAAAARDGRLPLEPADPAPPDAGRARRRRPAAAIMVFVFGSFLLETNRTVKLFGTGLATAVQLDATVVRMLLVPATMELLGDRNWWLPRWLDRVLPRIDVEGHESYDEAPAETLECVDRELENA
jgi:RND superfamily putative drug exporter